jgi:hypothetical protein
MFKSLRMRASESTDCMHGSNFFYLFFLCAKHSVEITRAHHVYIYKICTTSTSDDLKEVGIGEVDQPGHRILRTGVCVIS